MTGVTKAVLYYFHGYGMVHIKDYFRIRSKNLGRGVSSLDGAHS